MAQVTIAGQAYEHSDVVKSLMGSIFRNALVCSDPRWTKRGLETSFSGDTPIGNSYKMRNPQRTVSWAGTRPVYNVTESPTFDVVISNQEVIAHSYLSWEEKFFRLDESMSELSVEMASLTSIIDMSVTQGQVSTADRTYDGTDTWLMNETGVESTGAERAPNCFTDGSEDWGTGANQNQPFKVFSEAAARFHSQGIGGKQHVFLTPAQSAKCADALKGAYNPERTVSDYFNHGSIEFGKPVMGISTFVDTANMHKLGSNDINFDPRPTATTNRRSANPGLNLGTAHANGLQVHTAPGDGDEQILLKGLALTGLSASLNAVIFPKGTVLRFGSTAVTGTNNGVPIQSVNFQTRQPTGFPMEFVVIEDVVATADVANTAALPPVKVFPPIAAGSTQGRTPASTSQYPAGMAVRAATGPGSYKNKRMESIPPVNARVWINGVPGTKANTDGGPPTGKLQGKTFQTGYLWTPGTIGMLFVRMRMPRREEDAYQVEMPNQFSATTVKSYDDDLQWWTCKTRSTWGNVNMRPEQSGKFMTTPAP